jgi:L-glyceraldehyde 3-phosphate reductase
MTAGGRRGRLIAIQLPIVSLGLWQNFGDESPLATQQAILRHALDLANN